MVTVHCGEPPGGGSPPGRVQPLIVSKPLCSAHQEAAARSASSRVGAVNARQYFAVFNIPVDALFAGYSNEPVFEGHLQNSDLTHIALQARVPR